VTRAANTALGHGATPASDAVAVRLIRPAPHPVGNWFYHYPSGYSGRVTRNYFQSQITFSERSGPVHEIPTYRIFNRDVPARLRLELEKVERCH